MSNLEKGGNAFATSASSLDNTSILLKPMKNENIKKGFDEVAKEILNNLADDDPHKIEPTIMHTKKLCVGSDNIIGKGVI